MEDDQLKIIVIPSYLNHKAPAGESLVLVFTIEEMERARKRGESVVRNRMNKGFSRDDAIRSCFELS